jgi:hypothetical protein
MVPATAIAAACSKLNRLGFRHKLVPAADRVFREGSTTGAEHRLSDRQIGHVRADGVDDAGDVESPHLLTWTPPAGLRTQDPAHHDVVRWIDRRRTHSHEHLVASGGRPTDLLDLEGLRTSVTVLDNRPHRARPS